MGEKEKCRGYIHYRRIASACAWACHFAIDTGKLRGCDPEICPHYNSDRNELKRIQRQNKEYDLAQAFGLGDDEYDY